MTKIERYEAQVKEMEGKRQRLLTRGCYLQAMAMERDLQRARDLLEELKELNRPRYIKELMTPQQMEESGIVSLIAETHLSVDHLIVCLYNIMEVCKKYGILIDAISQPCNKLIKDGNEFVSQLMGKNEWLEDMLLNNETLNEAIHKKILSYISQRDKKYKTAKRKKEREAKKKEKQ